ncbi:MAG: CoA ester lyase [Ectothiorhodospiraceae bacterium]|nr:CoA ester lyase [Chromatiales bacterium]MCP5154187.1 CoA ester lyase [Ectothiorhodospiraceae bacterium]
MNATTTRELPVWRSLLYVPVNVDRFVDKAHARGADGIILDLEDSIPPAEKDTARTLVEAAAAKVSRGGADVLVRINRPLGLAARDIEHAVGSGVTALMLPKVASADHVRLLAEHVGEVEARRGMDVGHTRLVAMVETADAFFQLHAIAKADPRLVSVVLGGEDFALDVGFVPDPEVYLYPKQHALIAARAAGLTPMGLIGTVADYTDDDAFLAVVRNSARFGMEGASCIHPRNVAALNAGFTPDPKAVEQARKIVALDAEHAAAGRGSWELDGKMIDIPVVERARRLVARADRIAARASR